MTAVIHGQDVDQINADHVEDRVWKAVESRASHTLGLDRLELWMALDPRQARVDGANKRLAESWRSRLVPSIRLVKITLGTSSK